MKISFTEPQKSSEDVSLVLTKKAAIRIKAILEKQTDKSLQYLRVSVTGGGCSGFNYNFKLVAETSPADIKVSNKEVSDIFLIVDVASLEFLKGSTVDFEESLESSQFVINNPNAKNSCGCGNSFSI